MRLAKVSGVARTLLMLGHSMGTLCLYKILRKVQKHLGGSGHALLEIVWNFITSQVGSEAIS